MSEDVYKCENCGNIIENDDKITNDDNIIFCSEKCAHEFEDEG